MNDEKTARKALILLSTGHFINDAYSAYLPPLMPLLIANLGISLSLAGFLVTLKGISTLISQPMWGHVTDKVRSPLMVTFGPLVTGISLSMLGMMNNYPFVALLALIAGIGTAAFHPQAQVMVGNLGKVGRGLRLSVFSAMGTLGGAVSAIYVLTLASLLGFSGIIFGAIPCLILSASIWLMLPRNIMDTGHPLSNHSFLESLKYVMPKLWPVWAAGFSRDLFYEGIFVFFSVLMVEMGNSVMQAGVLLSVMTVWSAVCSIIGGWLSDKIGRLPSLTLLLTLPAPIVLFSFWLGGGAGIAGIIFAVGLLGGSSPITLALSQETTHDKAGIATSLVTGFSWGLAGAFGVIIGWISDQIGLSHTMMMLSILPLIGITILRINWKNHSSASPTL